MSRARGTGHVGQCRGDPDLELPGRVQAQQPETALLRFRQLAVRHVERRGDAATLGRHRDRRRIRGPQPLRHRRHRPPRPVLQPVRDQPHRQRQPPAQLHHLGRRVGFGVDTVAADRVTQHRHGVTDRQRVQAEQERTVDRPDPGPAGHQHHAGRVRRRQQRAYLIDTGHVVQHHDGPPAREGTPPHHLPARQVIGDALRRLAELGEQQTERVDRRDRGALAVTLQVHEQLRVGVRLPQRLRGGDGERGLADARHAVDDDHPVHATDRAQEPLRLRQPPTQQRHPRQHTRRGRHLRDRRGAAATDHVQVQLPQLRSRVDAELLTQRGDGALIQLQRLRLPPVAVQRRHQRPDQTLPQRMRGGQGRDPLHHLAVPPQREQRLRPLLRRRPAQLDQRVPPPRDHRTRQPRERRVTPLVQRRPIMLRGRRLVRLGAGQPQRDLETGQIQAILRQHHPVTRRVRLQAGTGRAEQPADAVHDGLQLVPGRRGRVVVPDEVHQVRDRDDPAQVEQQARHDQLLPGPAEVDGRAVGDHLDRTQHEALHVLGR